MRYQELIENVAQYGYGVFTLTMLFDGSERAALTKFIQRHPSFFQQFRGKQGDLKIVSLTSEGKKHFNLKHRLSEAQSWQSYVDIALFNAYMVEVEDWSKQVNRPHFLLNLKQGKVGLISSRWGINKDFHQARILLATEKQKTNLLNDQSFIAESVRELKTTPEKIRDLILNSYTPRAFLHIRNI